MKITKNSDFFTVRDFRLKMVLFGKLFILDVIRYNMNKKLTKKQKRTRNFKIGKYLVFAGMIILAISMLIFLPVNSWEESKIFVSLGFTSITLIGLGIRKAIIGKFF